MALALAMARRILHRELTVSPEALLGLVKAALEKMEAREVHQVRVSRQDAAMVRQFFEKMGLPQRVEVIADAGPDAGRRDSRIRARFTGCVGGYATRRDRARLCGPGTEAAS